MSGSCRTLPACAGLVVFVFAPTPAWAIWPVDPNANLTVCAASGDQRNATLLPDGEGGAFITWWDYRSGASDTYLQRVDFAGVPKWAANGIALSSAPGSRRAAGLVTDGRGGCIASWPDSSPGLNSIRRYAQRVDANGMTLWTSGGVRVCPVEADQPTSAMLADGAGGLFIAWSDKRSGNYDLYVQRLGPDGSPMWAADGVALCAAPGDQFFSTNVSTRIVSDGAGGFILAWYDQRAGVGNDDIYAQRVTASGSVMWTPNGVPLCTATGVQLEPVLCSNGLGGAIAAWTDIRSGIYRVYLQQVSAGGATLWAANGVQASLNGVAQNNPRIVSDGSNGAILVWLDNRASFDFYAQRMDNAGVPQWSPSDVALVTNPASQFGAEVASDGAGGVVVSWRDERSGSTSSDVYAQRVNAGGSVLWGSDGVAVSTAVGDATTVRMTADATGGAIIAWGENRGGGVDLYAQRVSGDGTRGGREPRIAAVQDVGPDQGGRARVLWEPSDLDAGSPPTGIRSYSLWRRVITTSAQESRAPGTPRFDGADPCPATGEPRRPQVAPEGAEATYWEYLVTIPAVGETGYAYMVATTADSMPGLIPWNVFRVMAESAYGPWYSSAPDSGYSMDNLPPGAPAPFTAALVSGSTALHWGVSGEPDLAGYRLYRGLTAEFVPGPENLVAAVPDTGYLDIGQAGRCYKLSAMDVHGNESACALVTPSGTLAVPIPAVANLLLEAVRPNPTAGASLTVRFVLPAAAPARLELLDIAGRSVVTRELDARSAGPHAVTLGDGRGFKPGIYLVRLTQGAASRTRRVVVLGD